MADLQPPIPDPSPRTAEQLFREIARIETMLNSAIESLGALTEARFVTYRTLLDSQAAQVSLALDAADKAITKAESATEKRLEAVNEFRAQLGDQAKTFLTREVFDAAMANLAQERDGIRRRMEELQLAMTGLMTREQVADTVRLVEAATERNRDDIVNLRTLQTRMAGVAIGVSAAISTIGILAAIVFRLASGH